MLQRAELQWPGLFDQHLRKILCFEVFGVGARAMLPVSGREFNGYCQSGIPARDVSVCKAHAAELSHRRRLTASANRCRAWHCVEAALRMTPGIEGQHGQYAHVVQLAVAVGDGAGDGITQNQRRVQSIAVLAEGNWG